MKKRLMLARGMHIWNATICRTSGPYDVRDTRAIRIATQYLQHAISCEYRNLQSPLQSHQSINPWLLVANFFDDIFIEEIVDSTINRERLIDFGPTKY